MPETKRFDRVKALLSEPLLLPDEERSTYDELLRSVWAAVQPTDMIEEIWTCEAVEKEWEALRQRRFKAGLLAANRQQALATILHPLLSYGFADASDDQAHMLAWQFTLGQQDAVNKVHELLANARLTMVSVDAQAMAMGIGNFESLDRLIWASEARRDALLDLIERRRAVFGHKLRGILSDAERSATAQLEGAPEQHNIPTVPQCED